MTSRAKQIMPVSAVIVTLLLIGFVTSLVQAQGWCPPGNAVYVDTSDGNDGNNGSQDLPLKTLSVARNLAQACATAKGERMDVYQNDRLVDQKYPRPTTEPGGAPIAGSLLIGGLVLIAGLLVGGALLLRRRSAITP